MSPDSPRFAAVIVAGGAGTRLSGVSKPELAIAGRTLMDRTLDACKGATSVVIVGGGHLRREGALWACEEPPGSGPAAGLAAGVAELDAAGDASPVVLVLGTDTPRASAVAAILLERVNRAAPDVDGAWVVDDEGTAQPLMAAYRRGVLADRCAAHAAPGASLRRVTSGLAMAELHGVQDASRDVDTWEDVEYWEGRL